MCPLLLQILHERIEFPLFVRVIRAFTTLLRDFGHVLITQCETLIGALLHCLASNGLNQGNVNNQSGDTGVFENGVGASQTEKVKYIYMHYLCNSLSYVSVYIGMLFFPHLCILVL